MTGQQPDRPVIGLLDEPARDPHLDIAIGPALLQQAARAGGSELLRIYRPRPTVAFSGRDSAAPGIGRAAAAARAHEFEPVRRGAGGRAVAYHGGALCIDHVSPDTPELTSIRERFAVFGDLLARTLRALGVDAAVGEVPGEYCPGEFSVNDGRGHKVVGTGQRLVPGAWLFSAVILISDPDPVRAVLRAAYSELELDWDPATVGAVDRSVPGLTWSHVHTALLAAYAERGELVPGVIPDSAIALARSRADRHRVRQS